MKSELIDDETAICDISIGLHDQINRERYGSFHRNLFAKGYKHGNLDFLTRRERRFHQVGLGSTRPKHAVFHSTSTAAPIGFQGKRQREGGYFDILDN